MEKIRLDKLLAGAGAGTRSEVKQYIRKGRVTIDGKICKNPDEKVVDTVMVCLDGQAVGYTQYEYYMLNKAAGCVSATRDKRYPTVMEKIVSPRLHELFPVGRLDLDTEGLLLITNDGELAHALLSPRKHVDKMYYAKVSGMVTDEDVEQFSKGLDIGENRPTLPAKLTILHAGEVSEVEVVIQEGKFHQIKRMFQAVRKEVLYLKRLRMGSLVLDPELESGQYRPLLPDEIDRLKEGAAYE